MEIVIWHDLKIDKNNLNKNIKSILNTSSKVINNVSRLHDTLLRNKKADIIYKLENCRVDYLQNYK